MSCACGVVVLFSDIVEIRTKTVIFYFGFDFQNISVLVSIFKELQFRFFIRLMTFRAVSNFVFCFASSSLLSGAT